MADAGQPAYTPARCNAHACARVGCVRILHVGGPPGCMWVYVGVVVCGRMPIWCVCVCVHARMSLYARVYTRLACPCTHVCTRGLHACTRARPRERCVIGSVCVSACLHVRLCMTSFNVHA